MQLIEQGQVVIPTGPMIKGGRPFYWILLKEANLFIPYLDGTHLNRFNEAIPSSTHNIFVAS